MLVKNNTSRVCNFPETLTTQAQRWLTGSLTLCACTCAIWTPAAQAEGSRELTNSGGDRPYLEYRSDSTGGILRRTTIQVVVEQGETLYLGSSAVGVGEGRIDYTEPDGTTGSCELEGLIESRAEEERGPAPLFTGGYDPCVVNNPQPGVWQINFVSPAPTSTTDPIPRPAEAEWPNQSPTDSFVTAWDVTVADGNAEVQGRAFANYIAFNLGANNQSLSAAPFILTEEGYLYRIDLNGLDPFGFIFFSNNRGFRRPDGSPFFASIPLDPPPSFQNPLRNPDTGADRTHRIFFNRPVPGILGTPVVPIPPGEVSDFTFTGADGTPSQAASPGGGTFSFDSTSSGSYRIILDLNSDGVFGNDNGTVRDRALTGSAEPGQNLIPWDGLDGNENPIPRGLTGYDVIINLFAAEVHFPFLDVEANPEGIILERLNGEGSPSFRVFYDNSLFSRRGLPSQGIPPDPLDASINGVDSSNGAHSFGCINPAVDSTCFGDERGIDTWSVLPSRDFAFTDAILIAQADLVVQKQVSPDPVVAGELITYTITVTNNGPNNATGATFRDTIPDAITNVNWTCAITTGTGSCATASGTGNAINTTLNLNNGATATYSVTGTLSPTASGTLTNTATIPLQPNNGVGEDVTDPDPSNNTSTIQTPIRSPLADLRLTKSATPESPNPGENVTFTIVVTNDGPDTATNVTVSDQLPVGLSFVAATPSQGTYDNQTGNWILGSLESGSSATLQLVATLNTANPVTNRAQVSTADQPDPDSTPGNSVAGEDDQDSVTVPLQLADLGLTKTASPTTVGVGENVTYTLTLTNNGPNTATDIAVTERLPQGLTFVSATPSQGTYNSTTGIWSVGNLSSGSSVTLQLVATGTTAGSIPNTAQITALDQSDPNPDNDQAGAEVVVQGEPNLRLVKRITAIARDGELLNNLNFNSFVDDPNDPNDNAPSWSQLQPVGTPSIDPTTLILSGDVVEYTIYFLSDGSLAVEDVKLCDAVPTGTTFINDSFGNGSGILLNQGGTQTPLTNASDTDQGVFLSPLTPATAPCANPNNLNGSVIVQLGDLPSTAPNNAGFVRFRVTID